MGGSRFLGSATPEVLPCRAQSPYRFVRSCSDFGGGGSRPLRLLRCSGSLRRRSIAYSTDSAAMAMPASRRPTAPRATNSRPPKLCKPPSPSDASTPPGGRSSSGCNCSMRILGATFRRPARSGAGSCGPTWLRLLRGEDREPKRNEQPHPTTHGKWMQKNTLNSRNINRRVGSG